MSSDVFGVRKIYPTKSGADGHEWFLNSSGSNVEGESLQTGSDSQGTYYTINSSQVRATALTKYGYKPGDIEWRARLIDINRGGTGHMQGKDPCWRDVEMSGYYYVTSSADDDFVHYCRGGRHSSSVNKCEGVAYKAAINYQNGQTRIRKEQWHSSGYISNSWQEAFGSSVRNRWVGFKFMCYNVPVGGDPGGTGVGVKMEVWIDKNNDNNWVKVTEFTDNCRNFGDGNYCDGLLKQALTWSAPMATFRWDTTGVRFKKLSVREINVGGDSPTPSPPPGSPPPGPPPPPGVPTPPPPGTDLATRFIYPDTGITAIGHDGNVPANINDQNFQTGWRYQALPAWIQVDLTTIKKVQYVRLRWVVFTSEYVMGFDVQTSTDNVTFQQVFTGNHVIPIGSGTFLQVEMPDHNARFVRINIHTNTAAQGVAMTELEVWGDDVPIGQEPPPPPPPEIPGPDPTYVYQSSIHLFHVNYTSTSTIDACALPIAEEGTGPQEIEGPDIFTIPPPAPGPAPPAPPPGIPPPGPETIPPLVISTTPSNTANSIPITQTVLIEMSEAMNIATITSTSVIISPSVAATFSLTGVGSNIINLDPVASLANGTVYTITVKSGASGVKDVAGNALPTDHVFSFTTIAAADIIAPTIISKTPDSGATGVAKDANIVITFSEPMLTARVTDSEIDLWQTSNTANVPRAVTLDASKTIATVNPVSDLGGGTQYTCRVRGGSTPSVADLAGNAMADPDISWNFTTVAPTYTLIYDYSGDGDSWTNLDHNPNKSVGLRLDDDSTAAPWPLIDKKPKRVDVLLRREGSPGGTITCKIARDVGSNEPLQDIAIIGTMNANDVTTAANGIVYTFANPGLNHPMEVDDCVIVETSAGTESVYIQVRRSDSDIWDKGILIRGTDTDINTDTGRDWPHEVYE